MHSRLAEVILLLFWLCTIYIEHVDAVWTEYDLVRPEPGGWGSEGTTSWKKVSATSGNGPATVATNSRFGWSMTNIGDLNGDGVDDLAVGAPGEDTTYTYLNEWGNATIVDTQQKTGALYVLFMTDDGECQSSMRISGKINGGPMIYQFAEFGYSVSVIGDLDGDGIQDLVVGAPGQLISSVYVLYMKRDGTARDHTLIRGLYEGTLPPPRVNGTLVNNNTYVPNGPTLRFLSRFGQCVLGMGDWDQDGVSDIAVSSVTADGGNGIVYFLYMFPNGTVKSFTSFGTNGDGTSINGAPSFAERTFVGFGVSLLKLEDKDEDGIPELAIGANNLDDSDTTHFKSGVVFVCFMRRDGSVKSFSRISELAEQYNRGPMPEKKKNTFYPGGVIPNVLGDMCGTALATIGDINQDEMRQQQPLIRSPKADDLQNNPNRISINDLVVGCPQRDTGSLPGRLFLIFLSKAGTMLGNTLVPGEKDVARSISPPLRPTEHFGHSLAGIQDLDQNGLRELAVGAPGALDSGDDSGAIYIIYLRRRRWHPFWTDTRAYWCAIIIPPSILMFGICVGIIYFFWKFRRTPDEIEILVLKSGVTVERKKKKNKKDKKEEKKVYIDDADDF